MADDAGVSEPDASVPVTPLELVLEGLAQIDEWSSAWQSMASTGYLSKGALMGIFDEPHKTTRAAWRCVSSVFRRAQIDLTA